MTRADAPDDWTRSPVRVVSAAVVLVVALGSLAWSIGRSPVADHLDTRPRTTLDLNTASEAELTLLPTIGPARAETIVADRDARGPYRSVDDLQRVAGVGPRTVLRIRPFASVTPLGDG